MGYVFQIDGEYSVGYDVSDTVRVTKTQAEYFIGKLALTGHKIDYFADPETGDEMWEAV